MYETAHNLAHKLCTRVKQAEAENAELKKNPQPIELRSDEKKQIYEENERRTVKTGREKHRNERDE
jgi:hypothetical protein